MRDVMHRLRLLAGQPAKIAPGERGFDQINSVAKFAVEMEERIARAPDKGIDHRGSIARRKLSSIFPFRHRRASRKISIRSVAAAQGGLLGHHVTGAAT